MSASMIELIISALVKYGPTVAREIQLLFTKENPTQEDWDKVFSLAAKSYEEYVAPKP